MKMAYKRKSYKRRASKRTYKRRASKRPRRSGVKAIVKREIARNIENKTIQAYDHGWNVTAFPNASFDTANILPMSPDAVGLIIPQGTGQGTRVGNKIKIKKLTFSGVVHPTPYNATSNVTPAPCMLKMYFFYDKYNPAEVPTVKANGDFFQFGSTTTTFQNDLSDIVSPINQDRYRVMATRTMKLGYAWYEGTGAQANQGNLSNNDFKLNAVFRVDLTRCVPKVYTFRDGVTSPTTRGIYMMAVPIYANGLQMSAATIPLQISWVQTCEYEDA